MSLSGTTNFNLTAGSIINRALNLLGVVVPWETTAPETSAVCMDFFNMMIKEWVTDGCHLWTQHGGTIVCDYGVATYTFADMSLTGASTGVVNIPVLQQTTLTAAAAASATVLVVASNAGMTIGDQIIVVLTNGTRKVTTIANLSSTTGITLAAGLTSAASNGAYVFSYPVALTRTNQFYPRQIFNVRLKDAAGWERELVPYSRTDYLMLSNKTLISTPVGFYIDDQLTNKTISLYPSPSDLRQTIRFTYTTSIQDAVALTDTLEFPQEWIAALVYNLAVMVAPVFGKESKAGTQSMIFAQAAEFKAAALNFDDEKVDIQPFIPRDY